MDEQWRSIGQRIVSAARLAAAMHLCESFGEMWRRSLGSVGADEKRRPAEHRRQRRRAGDDPRAGVAREAG